jgi:hypothetical protein
MGVANLTASGGGGGLASAVKSIQRGVASSAGTITISAVDANKTQVTSFSTGSAGTVAARGTVSASTGNSTFSLWNGGNQWNPANIAYENYFNGPFAQMTGRYGQFLAGYFFSYATSFNTIGYVSLNATNLSGGTTDLTSAAYGAYLTGNTTLVVTGPCRYEIVEYY